MRTTIGILLVTLPNSYSRGKTIYYQRAVPGDLRERYGAARVKVNLETKDVGIAARKIAALNSRVEAEWRALRGSPTAAPKSIRESAVEMLEQWDLVPAVPGQDTEHFLDHLDRKRERFARGDEQAYREAMGSEYLHPTEIEAARLLAGLSVPRLSDALDVYLKASPKRIIPKFVTFTRRSFGKLTAAVGDKPIADVSRKDGHALVTKMQADGLASSSIRRDLNVVRAVMSSYFLEKQINQLNPFSRIPIPGEGGDKEEANPYSTAELASLVTACKDADDEPRWLLSIISDTGARLAEVAGLTLAEIDLEAETPHIVIKAHPWRSLKNPGSARSVPLVGHALWAAKRIKETAKEGQRFAFPRYTTKTKTNGNSASATLNKWLKETVMLPHTVHELRHTMADRLREVECPQDIRFSIGGWSLKKTGGVGEDYGRGYGLRKMAEWLHKVIPLAQ